MDRRRRAVEVAAAAAAVMVLLLLPIVPAGGARRDWGFHPPSSFVGYTEPNTKPDIRNSGQSFVFNYTLAKAIVEYASAVYMTDLTALYTWTCSRCNDLTRGFEVTCIIVDVQNCLQAFVGVDPNLNAIIVAIRGTQENSIQNWIKDLIWKQVNLNYPNMPNAKVHIGFYSSYNNTLLRPAITNAVRKARKLHGDCDIIVTGHSMGGAIASFCVLDLAISFGSDNVHLMSFGQPRVGNAAFASYFAKYVPKTIRMTHERDIVPHLPPYFFFLPQLTYRHFPREVWEHDVDGNTTFQVCDGSGEDPNCSRSVFVLFWSASDHLTYMGVKIEADDWSTCRIVMGQSVEQLGMSLASNIATSGHSVDVVIADHSVQVD
ncbi:hypothetical protein SEVIR_9G408500v4 [Setaria viridis]|uniref:Fungal lipase-type domain-containing protein n=1 Tax=Setaria viridis TaxID=4556 RepID=A0A4U6TFU2_SETVI|nr:lipase-like [Setaria viridis]TKV96116.1 hypothetical protein SEVIR_9G408500v2 [Setaria viridis]